MKHLLLTTIAAVVLVGCGGSKTLPEIIFNPWTWIGILANLPQILTEISVFFGLLVAGCFLVGLLVAGYFLVRFLCRKHRAKKTGEELKAEGK